MQFPSTIATFEALPQEPHPLEFDIQTPERQREILLEDLQQAPMRRQKHMRMLLRDLAKERGTEAKEKLQLTIERFRFQMERIVGGTEEARAKHFLKSARIEASHAYADYHMMPSENRDEEFATYLEKRMETIPDYNLIAKLPPWYGTRTDASGRTEQRLIEKDVIDATTLQDDIQDLGHAITYALFRASKATRRKIAEHTGAALDAAIDAYRFAHLDSLPKPSINETFTKKTEWPLIREV